MIRFQDITPYVQRDPQYQFPIGAGAGGNIYRGIYHRMDPGTNQEQSLNVSSYVWPGASH
jgi:hypothetical protein